MNHGSIHNPGTVPARIFQALRYSATGMTTWEIQQLTRSTAVSTDISAVRQQLPDGLAMERKYEGLSDTGRKVHRYRIVRVAKAGCLF